MYLQQTPNPAAQFPSATPDLEEHSELVSQVPDVPDVVVELHSRFEKETTLKRENCPEKNGLFTILFIKNTTILSTHPIQFDIINPNA